MAAPALLRELINKLWGSAIYKNKTLNGNVQIHPIFPTKAEEVEYAKIENKPIPEIEDTYLRIIQQMNADDQCILMDYYRKNVRKKVKSKHVEFYNIVIDTFDSKYTYDDENIEDACNAEVWIVEHVSQPLYFLIVF